MRVGVVVCFQTVYVSLKIMFDYVFVIAVNL